MEYAGMPGCRKGFQRTPPLTSSFTSLYNIYIEFIRVAIICHIRGSSRSWYHESPYTPRKEQGVHTLQLTAPPQRLNNPKDVSPRHSWLCWSRLVPSRPICKSQRPLLHHYEHRSGSTNRPIHLDLDRKMGFRNHLGPLPQLSAHWTRPKQLEVQ